MRQRFSQRGWYHSSMVFLSIIVLLFCGLLPCVYAAGEATASVSTSPSWWTSLILTDDLASLTRTRAVFTVQRTGHGGGIESTQYVLCGPREGLPGATTMAAAADVPNGLNLSSLELLTNASVVCGNVADSHGNGSGGARRWVIVEQRVHWGTLLPPGIHPIRDGTASTSAVSSGDFFYRCGLYHCDMQNSIPSAFLTNGSGNVQKLGDGYGGLSPATPCCGSSNSTHILYTPVRAHHSGNGAGKSGNCTSGHEDNTSSVGTALLVQADVLPLPHLQAQAQRILDTAYCGSVGCKAPAGKCAIRLMNPRFFSSAAALTSWHGDGGVRFPVTVSLCGADISDAISTSSASLLRRGYSVVLTAHEHADTVAFPNELIRSIASWLAAARGHPETKLINSRWGSGCVWRHNVSMESFYRTGNYLACDIDSSLVGSLPPLTVTVHPDSVLAAYDTSGNAESRPRCTFSIDLNRCIRALKAGETSVTGGVTVESQPRYQLVLYASGSLTEAMRTANLLRFREPLIVLGMYFSPGATVAVSRSPSFNAPPAGSPATVAAAFVGMPVLFLAAYNQPLSEDQRATGPHASLTAACTTPATCSLDRLYYPSLNLCGETGCVGIFAYVLDPGTLTCSLRPALIVLFSVFAAVLIAGDVVLVFVGRWMEQQRKAHMKLIEQVQRKTSA